MSGTLDGIPGLSPATKGFVQAVRLYLRDHAELNRLVRGEETNDRMLLWCVKDAVSDFNSTPHRTFYSLDELLQMDLSHLLVRLTVITVLESVGLLQTRNHINYSTGGTNVGMNDKTPLILNWLQLFKSSAEQKKSQIKVALNIESILGSGNAGVFSEYWAVNSTYLAY